MVAGLASGVGYATTYALMETAMERMKRANLTIVAALLACILGAPSGRAQASFRDTLQPLVNYFGDLRLIPVIVPRGQAVGDVYDLTTLQLVHDHSECFPTAQPKTLQTELPPFQSLSKETAFLSFGVSMLGDARASADIERATQIGFTDLSVSTITEAGLKQSFNKTACPELEAAISERTSSFFQRKLVVVGEVYVGHRALQLELSTNADVKAKVRDLAAFFSAGGVSVQVLAGAGAGGRGQIIVKSNQASPIAIRPAFVARPLYDQTMGADPNKSGSPQFVKWESFDVDLPSQAALLKAMNQSLVDSATATGKLP